MKLIDRVLNAPALITPRFIRPEWRDRWTAHCAKVLDIIKGSYPFPVLNIDNVSDYYYHGSDQEVWNIERDFPNLAPPYPVFWCEHHLPSHLRSETNGRLDFTQYGLQKARVGALFLACDPDAVTLFDGSPPMPEGTRWIYAMEVFHYWGVNAFKDLPEGPVGTYIMAVGENGELLGRPVMQAHVSTDDQDALAVLHSTLTWLYPMFLAITFMHCRNVIIEDNTVPAKLAKRTFERHGYKPQPYKTLIIEPLKQILKTEGGSHKHGLAKAMHICRGHFKDYRQGKGLFGKYHQMVWQPMVVRGSKGDKPAPREVEVRAPK